MRTLSLNTNVLVDAADILKECSRAFAKIIGLPESVGTILWTISRTHSPSSSRSLTTAAAAGGRDRHHTTAAWLVHRSQRLRDPFEAVKRFGSGTEQQSDLVSPTRIRAGYTLIDCDDIISRGISDRIVVITENWKFGAAASHNFSYNSCSCIVLESMALMSVELPEDILMLILGALEVPDLVRAGSVCSSWHGAYTNLRDIGRCKQQQTPCLLFTAKSYGAGAAGLYSLTEKKPYRLALPDPPICCCSLRVYICC
ncbi:hypothetical protein PR202_gb28325 [Eleusine coracana subsp. coracana]|uniref:F-box domain-containing protein n=1 Tax=Eleusine coracana subsp. coracana TaxID=191504 RepID=A0AAV5FXJ6_ELECO|nr:hypothetical protein PR202_gb28325 [Eleusine coracana subsp. coracana]